MFKYLPATFLYTSHVTESERSAIDQLYMPFVLQNSHKESKDVNNVRTDYFDRSAGPWDLFIEIMLGHFRSFAGEHLLNGGSYLLQMDPWFNYYASQSAMYHHSHPGNDFGLVYCLRNAGRKKTLFNTFSHEYDSMECRYPKLVSCKFQWDPVPGEFAFFPASLFHATQLAEIDGERITLIANLVMTLEKESDVLSMRVEQHKRASVRPDAYSLGNPEQNI